MSDTDAPKRASTKPSRKGSGSAPGADDDADAHAETPREPQPCMPCHGSGKVISNLGGHTRKVTCPWCRGGGVRLTGVDAQEWHEEQAALKRH